jgi:hypothetical protein
VLDHLPVKTCTPNRSLIYTSLEEVFKIQSSWSCPLASTSTVVLITVILGYPAEGAVSVVVLLAAWWFQAQRLRRRFEQDALCVAISPVQSVHIQEVARGGLLCFLQGFLTGFHCGGRIRYTTDENCCICHENLTFDRALMQVRQVDSSAEVKAFVRPGSFELVALLHEGELIWVLGQQPFQLTVASVLAEIVRKLKRFAVILLFTLIFALIVHMFSCYADPAFREFNVASACALYLTVLAMALLKSTGWLCQGMFSPRFSSCQRVIEWWCFSFLVMLLTAMAIPGMVGADQKNKQRQVIANMVELSSIVENYARLHSGQFPADVEGDIRFYYPGGSPAERKPGCPPVNPFTKRPEWPIRGAIKNIRLARQAPSGKLSPGVVEYSPISNSEGKITDYAIRGAKGYGVAVDGFYAQRPNSKTWKTLVICAAKKDVPMCTDPRCGHCLDSD